jgi:hypothetical protein
MRQGNRRRQGDDVAKKLSFAKKPKGRKKKGGSTEANSR